MQPPAEHQSPRCPNCLNRLVVGATGCASCGREFGAPLKAGENSHPDPELLRGHRWTWISLGRDPMGRIAGKTLATAWVLFALYAFLANALSDDLEDLGVPLIMIICSLINANVIHAFTHGRPIEINRLGHFEATPVNTGIRTLVLAWHLVIMLFAMWIFLR